MSLESTQRKLKDLSLMLLTLKFCKRIDGRKRFHKIVYLLKKKYDVPFSVNFRPYYYGPYSEELRDLIQLSVDLGLIKEEKKSLDDNYLIYCYKLTSRGQKYLNEYFKKYLDFHIEKNLQKGVGELSKYPTPILERISKQYISSEYNFVNA